MQFLHYNLFSNQPNGIMSKLSQQFSEYVAQKVKADHKTPKRKQQDKDSKGKKAQYPVSF